MSLALDNVVQDFINANGKIAQGYFDLSGKIIDSICASHCSREQVLLRLLEQAQAVTAQYLDAHQQVVQSLYLKNSSGARFSAPALAAPTLRAVTPAVQREAANTAASITVPSPVPAYESWLRSEISAVSGMAADAIDLRQNFDSLGLDSLNRVELFDALAKAFPETREQATGFFDLGSPAAVLAELEGAPAADSDPVASRVLAHLAALTGFALDDLDAGQAYEEQGLDSLIRLDFLDLLLGEWPQLKAHENLLGEARCAQQSIEQIRRLLAADSQAAPAHEQRLQQAIAPLLAPGTQAADHQQPFAELGLNGFDRATLCQALAADCRSSEFAGEALMSRRNPEEALALLQRMA
ncbi:acyl carrier protein [Pseudomonas sp. NFXW11]|uniref:acyl carrier protein n=1 Tax=Pseudomonas sp. NFXW11 TaxID=2819531 RepID=UPI003CE6D73C